MEYKLIIGATPEVLSENVTKELKEGATLYGSPGAIAKQGNPSQQADLTKSIHYFQAILKSAK